MKDEIKEILELTIQFVEEELDKGTPKKDIIKAYSTQVGEAFNHIKDYITNLQEENERLRKDYGRLLQDNAYTLELEQKIDKATEIYKNRNTCKYKKEKFMKDKSTSDLMYEALQGSDKE